MSETKQVVINKELHRKVKGFCVNKDQPIKEYAEAVLEFAVENEMTIEKLKDKQYMDSLASTNNGGPMMRYGVINEQKEEKTSEPERETMVKQSKSENGW